MLAVAVGAIADDLRQDVRATGLRVFQVFQHQRAGTLAQHQAIAVGVERTWRQFRLVVAHAGGEQGVEHRGRRGIQLLRATGDHRDLLAAAYGLVGATDALAARGAGTGGCLLYTSRCV